MERGECGPMTFEGAENIPGGIGGRSFDPTALYQIVAPFDRVERIRFGEISFRSWSSCVSGNEKSSSPRDSESDCFRNSAMRGTEA
jgi:hypothetical protein